MPHQNNPEIPNGMKNSNSNKSQGTKEHCQTLTRGKSDPELEQNPTSELAPLPSIRRRRSSTISGDEILEDLNRLPPIRSISLSFTRKIAIASGHILNDLCASLWFSYLLLYFQKVVEFDKTSTSSSNDSRYAAGLMFLGQIVDGLATPLVGYKADQDINRWLCGKSYGRCKSWHLAGVVLVMISFPFVFAPCIGCSSESSIMAKLIYYSTFIVVFQIGWASTQISHLAYAFTVGANVTIFLMTWFTLGNNNDCKITPDDADNFMKIALIAVGIGSIFTILFHVFVKEESDQKVKQTVAILNSREELIWRLSQADEELAHFEVSDDECGYIGRPLLPRDEDKSDVITQPHISSSNADRIQGTRISSSSTRYLSLGKERMSIKDWMTLPQFYLVALIYLSAGLSMNLTQVYVPLYLQDSLKLPCRTVATVPLTMYISGFTVSLFIKIINKYFGRQLAYILGATLMLAGSVLILILNWDGPNTVFLKTYMIYCVAALLGGGGSAILVTSLSITADLIGNNVENGAFVYGAMSFCDRLSCGIGVLLICAMIPCFDEENITVGDGDTCDKADNIPFYRNVLAFSGGGCALLGVFGVFLLTIRIHIQNSQRSQ